jgi:hypothetical protein
MNTQTTKSKLQKFLELGLKKRSHAAARGEELQALLKRAATAYQEYGSTIDWGGHVADNVRAAWTAGYIRGATDERAK